MDRTFGAWRFTQNSVSHCLYVAVRDRYNGRGFVRSDDSRSSQFAEVQATERKGGAYPLPFKAEGGAYPLPFNADGNSLWSGKFRYYTVDGNEDEVAKQKSESAFHRSMDHPVLNRIRSSWRATRECSGGDPEPRAHQTLVAPGCAKCVLTTEVARTWAQETNRRNAYSRPVIRADPDLCVCL